jgi:hypothetical protein
VRKINKEKTMDAHNTASALIAEITDLRAQLAGEKATNARLQGLLNQATVRIADLERTTRPNIDGGRLYGNPGVLSLK